MAEGGGKNSSNGSVPVGSKPKIRKKSSAREPRSRSPKKTLAAAAAMDIEQELDDLEQTVSVRVRGPDSPSENRPRSRIGALLRDPSPSAIKETIKRPLSGIFKRPGSRGASRERKAKADLDKDEMDMGLEENGSIAMAAAATPSKPAKKHNLFDGSRPGTAFGRRFSFGKKKKKEGNLNLEEDFAEDDNIQLDGDVGVKRKGIIELPDSSSKDRSDRNTDSPDIPNLEEVEGAAFGTMHQVAQAPSVAVNRVATYRELDNELMKQAAFATLEDIDLSLLTKFLCPESEVRDEDVPWSWDYLYTSICSELRSEWEGEDENSDDEGFIGGGGEQGGKFENPNLQDGNSKQQQTTKTKAIVKTGLF